MSLLIKEFPNLVYYIQVSTPPVVPLEASQTDQSEHRAPEVLSNLPPLQTLIKVWDCEVRIFPLLLFLKYSKIVG